jgi:hypothetical protein
MEEIEFLGHIIDANGVRLSDARVQGIRAVPEPTLVQAVRSFIGMVNYFRDFIPDLSGHLIPLFALTSEKRQERGSRCQLLAEWHSRQSRICC